MQYDSSNGSGKDHDETDGKALSRVNWAIVRLRVLVVLVKLVRAAAHGHDLHAPHLRDAYTVCLGALNKVLLRKARKELVYGRPSHISR